MLPYADPPSPIWRKKIPILVRLICFSEANIFEHLNILTKWPTQIICINICGFSSVQIYSDIYSVIS